MKCEIVEMDCDSNGIISDSITHVESGPDNIEPFLAVTFFRERQIGDVWAERGICLRMALLITVFTLPRVSLR